MAQLQSALDHYRRQRRIAALGLIGARRELQRGNATRMASVVALAQLQAAQDSVSSTAAMLDEQNVEAPAVAAVLPSAFSGVASDGRVLASLLEVVSRPEMPAGSFERAVLTQISDAGRAAASASMAARPRVSGYVRMLVPPSCSRCAILAGKSYRWNQGFQRHPRCDCRHIPAAESTAGDLTTDPRAYFDSLDAAEQERIFTKAGAQAIRDGADMAQVVNARRGMTTAQIGGRDVRFTREGVTRRGLARSRMGTKPVRIMPETIYEVATDRADAIRLLRTNGYLTD